MQTGEYTKLKPNQKRWLGWILEEQGEWLKIHINAPNNLMRLHWSYTSGIYDAPTQQLLNFILNRFNEHIVTKNRWKIYNEWRIKTNEDLEL